jgi:hypothetical protein
MNNDPTYGPASQSESPQPKPEKDPAAVSLGRRGGLKGGKARAAKLSQERKAEIAKGAAVARWKNHAERQRKIQSSDQ